MFSNIMVDIAGSFTLWTNSWVSNNNNASSDLWSLHTTVDSNH